MELQRFVTEVIKQMGGVVILLEYALCEALIPEEYSEIFSGRTEVMLAFDIEVAQENPNAEFVTFGSYLLDRMLEIVKKKPVYTLRYAVVDRLSLNNPEEAIHKYLDVGRAGIKILEEKPVMGIWPLFTFCIQYMSDEKLYEVHNVWINPITDKYEVQMENIHVFYENKPLYNYPVILSPDFTHSFESAYQYVIKYASEQAKVKTNLDIIEKEMQRIEYYYEDLKEENQKLMNRKGISNERLSELSEKHKVFDMEKERQIREIQEKYKIKTDISLDHSFTYFIPMIEYTVEIKKNGDAKSKTLYYNPILKSFHSNFGDV